MTPIDLRILCTALGFTAVIMQDKHVSKKDGALRATALAHLIEKFCYVALPDIFGAAETGNEAVTETPDVLHRMADAIVEIYKQKGQCQPHDLRHDDFTSDEIARNWPMAYALAKVELNIMDS